jgi:hypothetical protein
LRVFDEAGLPEFLQMRAGEFHADLGLCGEHLDCFFALAQELEEL